MVDEDGFVIRPPDKKEKHQWSSATSSSDEDENEFQTSKIRQLQIKPINKESTKTNISVEELRNAMGNISLQRSTTFENDPWKNLTDNFSQSLNSGKPLRAALTGDDTLRKKSIDFDFSFSQSIGSGSGIARARPRSNTPTVSGFGLSATSGMNPVTLDSRTGSVSSDIFFDAKNEQGHPGSNSGFSDSFSSFNFQPNPSSNSQQSSGQKYPIAMAVNEFVHTWFKNDTEPPEVKVFGTVVISFPALLFKVLTEVTPDLKPIKFYLENAKDIKTVMPNKRLILPTPLPDGPTEVYNFVIDKIALANWLLDQEKQKPGSNFYNIDIIRYELNQNFKAPLNLKSYWKVNQDETGIRIDFELNPENQLDKTLLNINFTTKVAGDPELSNSAPEAKFDKESGILSWIVTELTPHGEKSGSLKARLKLNSGPSTPENTFVQFQVSFYLFLLKFLNEFFQVADKNMSNLVLKMDPENGYNLSMTKRKLISGKYFCEPEVRN